VIAAISLFLVIPGVAKVFVRLQSEQNDPIRVDSESFTTNKRQLVSSYQVSNYRRLVGRKDGCGAVHDDPTQRRGAPGSDHRPVVAPIDL
jgi:hypothetical protein